jgi:CHAT domain-containing protein/tetratricopeptide (TPR) repeat protein
MVTGSPALRQLLLVFLIGTLLSLGAMGATLFVLRTSPDVIVSLPSETIPPVPVEPFVERNEPVEQALERVRNQLRLASDSPNRKAERADLLMRLAELCREAGQTREARMRLEEIQTIHATANHWQAREANRRIVDLDAEENRPAAERQRLREARVLQRSAAALYQTGHYLPALALCEKALALRRELLPNSHVDVAESLLQLGRAQAQRGEAYQKAFETLSNARELLHKSLGDDHPQYAVCLHELALLEDDRGAFVEAQDLYNAALEIFRKSRGEFSAEYARSLAHLARMHGEWWVTGAEAKMLRAMHIRETVLGSTHPDFADSLQDLGILLFANLQIEKARNLFLKAKQIREATLGRIHPANAGSLSWMGRAMVDEVDFTAGHEYHRQAVALAEQGHGLDHPVVARIVANFARLSMEEFDFVRGERLMTRALAIRNRLGLTRHPLHGEFLRARADNLQEWCFITVYLEGIEVDIRPAVAAYEEATRLFEALPTSEMIPDYAATLLAHAELYYINDYKLKSHSECRNLVNRGKELMLLRGPLRGHPFYHQYLTASIHVAAWEGDLSTAESLTESLMEYCEGRFGYAFPSKRTAGMDKRIGLWLRQQGDEKPLNARDLATYNLGVDREMLFLRRVQACQSTAARLRILVSSTEYLHGLTSMVLRGRVPLDVYQTHLTLRGLVGAAQTVDTLAHDRPDLAPFVTRLRETRREMTRAVYTPAPDKGNRRAWLDKVYQLSDQRDDLESELAIRVRSGMREHATPAVNAVQAALPPRTVLIEYCHFQFMKSPPNARGRLLRIPSLVAFVIQKEGSPKLIPLGHRAPIEKAIDEWRTAIAESQSSGGGDKLSAATARIARVLWEPVAPHIGSADTLLISADGLVGLVPFAMFPGKTPGSYLLEDFTIGYIPAGRRVIGTTAQTRNPDRNLLTVGDVDYTTGNVSRMAHPVLRGLPRLPGTAIEVADVQRQFKATWSEAPVTTLEGKNATLEAFTAAVTQRPWVIHFAGHGFFADLKRFPDFEDGPAGKNGLIQQGRKAHPAILRNQSLLSGLLLARGTHPADSLLTAEQVASLDLRSTDLVVLSACETGIGDFAIGEGMMSLQRAFLNAGARTVVGSLWKVDDAATVVLMEEFYRNLWEKKQPKSTALRNAQLKILRRPELIVACANDMRSRGVDTSRVRPLPTTSAPAQRVDPTLWGAFVLTGDGR